MVMAAGVLMASFKHDNYMKRNFSYTEHISVDWVKRVILLLFLMLVVWVLIIWLTKWPADSLFYFFQIAVWTYIYGYTIKHVVVNIPQEALSADSDSGENTKEIENVAAGDISFAAKLKRCMENESLYLNENLSLSDVAAAIGTNRTYLSDFLNNQMNVSFYDYVNNYRVQKACDILLEGNYSLLEEVAERCGFNSLSTFRRAFRKKMHTTPIEYKKKATR